MAKLPEPTVTSRTKSNGDNHRVEVTISRDGKDRNYTGRGDHPDAAIADVVKRIIVDPHTSEYIP